jgi:GTPase SAR1 family protein
MIQSVNKKKLIILQDLDEWRDYDVDGFIVVYSIIDRRSYQKACDLISSIRDRSGGNDQVNKPVVLVANKSDLERSRMIGKEGTMSKLFVGSIF